MILVEFQIGKPNRMIDSANTSHHCSSFLFIIKVFPFKRVQIVMVLQKASLSFFLQIISFSNLVPDGSIAQRCFQFFLNVVKCTRMELLTSSTSEFQTWAINSSAETRRF